MIFQDASGNDLWKIDTDHGDGDKLVLQLYVGNAWTTVLAVDQTQVTLWAQIFSGLAVNKHSGMPFQKGLSIGMGKKDGSDAGAGVNYTKMFSDDSNEHYFQINEGMHGAPNHADRFAFKEAIDQNDGGNAPIVDFFQHRVRTIDDATSSTSSRDAYVIDGGTLANGWERFFKWWGNSGSVVVAGVSAWLSGIDRRLRFYVNNGSGNSLALVAEMHEDGGMTIGNVASKGVGTLNVASGLYVNGVAH